MPSLPTGLEKKLKAITYIKRVVKEFRRVLENIHQLITSFFLLKATMIT